MGLFCVVFPWRWLNFLINRDCTAVKLVLTLQQIYKYMLRMKSPQMLSIATLMATSMSATAMSAAPIETPKHPFPTLHNDSSRVNDLDEVVIVSQPKDVYLLRRQPLSSTVFSAREIDQLQLRDLRDLSAFVPSFAMPNYGARLTSSMYVRGIGSRVNSPAVGVYIDDLPIQNKAAFNMHAYQLDRVDVLRGPQSTLYGQNTQGGLVRMYTRNPMSHQGTDVLLSGGTAAYRKAEVSHATKVNDAFAFSVAGFYSGQDGFFKNAHTGDKADSYNEAGGKVKLVFRPNARLDLQLLADYQHTQQNAFPYGQLDLATNSVQDPATTTQSKYRRDLLHSGVNLTYRAEGFDFHSITSYQYLNDRMQMDIDYLPADWMNVEQRQRDHAVTQEFVLKSTTPSFWRWTFGAFGSYQNLKTDAPIDFASGMDSFLSNTIQRAMHTAMVNSMVGRFIGQGMTPEAAAQMAATTIERAGGVKLAVDLGTVPGTFRTPQLNYGLFHESNWRLTNRLTATGAIRYDYSRVWLDYATSASMTSRADVMGRQATVTVTSELADKVDNEFHQFLPKFGLSYRLDDRNSNIYATVSKGYRAGGFNIQMFSDILQAELQANSTARTDLNIPHDAAYYDRIRNTIAYRPEVTWNYEVGTHLNLFNNALHLDLSAYYMTVRNQQLSVMAGQYGFGRMMVNAGRSQSCGVEATMRGSALDNRLTWALNYSFTHAQFQDYADSIRVGGALQPVSYEGKRVPFVPQHSFGAAVDYRWNLAAGPLKAIVLGANLTGQGKTYWDEANSYGQNLYAVLGAHLDAHFRRASVSLWGRNLTDTRYQTFAISSAATGQMLRFAQLGNPLQVGVDVKFHF